MAATKYLGARLRQVVVGSWLLRFPGRATRTESEKTDCSHRKRNTCLSSSNGKGPRFGYLVRATNRQGNAKHVLTSGGIGKHDESILPPDYTRIRAH